MSVRVQAGNFLKSSSICKEKPLQPKLSNTNGVKAKPRSTLTHSARSTASNASAISTSAINSVETNHCTNGVAHINHNSNPNRTTWLTMSDDAADAMFSVGSIVVVETGWGHSFEGEVIAFDYKYKILLLKCSALSGNTTRSDIHLINLECAKNVRIKKEAKRKDSTNFPTIEIDKVEQRKMTAIDERKRLVKAFDAGINEDGLRLFLHLSKTLNATFEGKNIIVMKDVQITHPYKADNCAVNSGQGANSSSEKKMKGENAVSYVKQLVEKFWSEN